MHYCQRKEKLFEFVFPLSDCRKDNIWDWREWLLTAGSDCCRQFKTDFLTLSCETCRNILHLYCTKEKTEIGVNRESEIFWKGEIWKHKFFFRFLVMLIFSITFLPVFIPPNQSILQITFTSLHHVISQLFFFQSQNTFFFGCISGFKLLPRNSKSLCLISIQISLFDLVRF